MHSQHIFFQVTKFPFHSDPYLKVENKCVDFQRRLSGALGAMWIALYRFIMCLTWFIGSYLRLRQGRAPSMWACSIQMQCISLEPHDPLEMLLTRAQIEFDQKSSVKP